MNELRAYCTYFDSGYLSRGLALIRSLREHGDDAPVWVLALDDAARSYLDDARLPGVFTLTMADIEASEPLLAPLRVSRSRMEYIFTSTPLLLRWVIDKQEQHDTVVIYLDSDLYFFDDPSLVLGALGTGSVGIIEHKYPPRVAGRLAKYGRFNVGWVGIRGDTAGRECLDWWAQSTLEWCFDKPENGRYADQGYLDQFPSRFESVVVLPSTGFNLAPWNTARAKLDLSDDGVVVDNTEPLVFFHFHGLRRVGKWYVSSQLVYGAPMGRILRDDVYTPYAEALEFEDAAVTSRLGRPPSNKRGNGLRGIASRVRKSALDRLSILSGNAVRIGRQSPRAVRSADS
jgi:hypothetical protein